jgi:hypothetical protein
MRVKQTETQQVRISTELCELVTKIAHQERRTFRAQLEILIEAALLAGAPHQVIETRKGANNGE